jgi:hypothetical protein
LGGTIANINVAEETVGRTFGSGLNERRRRPTCAARSFRLGGTIANITTAAEHVGGAFGSGLMSA